MSRGVNRCTQRYTVTWVGGFGTLRRAGVECTGSYGAALSRCLLAAGLEVFEVNQPDKAGRRRRGKTDAIDAPGRRSGSVVRASHCTGEDQ